MRIYAMATVAAVLLTACRNADALDKERLSEHLRKALNETRAIEFVVGDPEDSDFKGLWAVPVTIKTPRGNQVQTILVGKDEKKYILGSIIDLTVDPDEERASKIDVSGFPAKGSPDAPVTIVKYSDLECGFCRKAHIAIEDELYEQYSKDQVRFVFKHFPLNSHPWSERGAIAVECAFRQGGDEKAFEMIDRLFQDAPSITPENVSGKIAAFAREIGLKSDEFQACLTSDDTRESVQAQREEGIQVGVRSTPTFFVNGRMVKGFRDFGSLKIVIDEKLDETR